MSQITISSHDYLGKLSVIKNALFLLKEKPAGGNYDSKDQELVEMAYNSAEALIQNIKTAASLQPSAKSQEV